MVFVDAPQDQAGESDSHIADMRIQTLRTLLRADGYAKKATTNYLKQHYNLFPHHFKGIDIFTDPPQSIIERNPALDEWIKATIDIQEQSDSPGWVRPIGYPVSFDAPHNAHWQPVAIANGEKLLPFLLFLPDIYERAEAGIFAGVHDILRANTEAHEILYGTIHALVKEKRAESFSPAKSLTPNEWVTAIRKTLNSQHTGANPDSHRIQFRRASVVNEQNYSARPTRMGEAYIDHFTLLSLPGQLEHFGPKEIPGSRTLILSFQNALFSHQLEVNHGMQDMDTRTYSFHNAGTFINILADLTKHGVMESAIRISAAWNAYRDALSDYRRFDFDMASAVECCRIANIFSLTACCGDLEYVLERCKNEQVIIT